MTKANNTAVIGFTLFTTKKAIMDETERLGVVGKSYQVDLHVLACSVLQHLGKNGNIGIVTQFLTTIPDVVRKNALCDWFEAFSKATFLDKDGAVMKTPVYSSAKVQRLGNAMEKPFWSFKANEGAPYKPMVMDTYIDQQIKKLQKDALETKADHSVLIAAFHKAKLAQPSIAVN